MTTIKIHLIAPLFLLLACQAVPERLGSVRTSVVNSCTQYTASCEGRIGSLPANWWNDPIWVMPPDNTDPISMMTFYGNCDWNDMHTATNDVQSVNATINGGPLVVNECFVVINSNNGDRVIDWHAGRPDSEIPEMGGSGTTSGMSGYCETVTGPCWGYTCPVLPGSTGSVSCDGSARVLAQAASNATGGTLAELAACRTYPNGCIEYSYTFGDTSGGGGGYPEECFGGTYAGCVEGNGQGQMACQASCDTSCGSGSPFYTYLDTAACGQQSARFRCYCYR